MKPLGMSEPPAIFRIRTPYKKCRHCGHRVPNPHDNVCPNCYVPHGNADRAMSSAIKWLGIGFLVIVFLALWPSLYHLLMEVVD